jgi:hypothetical protein
MRLRTSKWALAVLGLGAVLGGAAGTDRDEAWVRERVRQVKQSDTTAWQKVPWAASLVEARAASAREKRPLFLFTYDGNIETGRC